jgi:hypothetical protein
MSQNPYSFFVAPGRRLSAIRAITRRTLTPIEFATSRTVMRCDIFTRARSLFCYQTSSMMIHLVAYRDKARE